MALLAAPAVIDHLGWPAVFFLFGGAGLAWVAVWMPAMHVHEPGSGVDPLDHPDPIRGGAFQSRVKDIAWIQIHNVFIACVAFLWGIMIRQQVHRCIWV